MQQISSCFVFLSDYEHLLILFLLSVLFFIGLKKRELTDSKWPSLDINYSTALKGIGCVFVLMGHYEANIHIIDRPETYWFGSTIWHTTANIGLVWFMFISGYGLTVTRNRIDNHWSAALKRISKVYFPLLFVSILAFPLFLGINGGLLDNWKESLLFLFGWGDWYVTCIIIFYVLFYVSDFISSKIKSINAHEGGATLVLFLLLVFYFIITSYLLGRNNAHYFRLTWAFLFGHLLVVYKSIPKWLLIVCLSFGFGTFYFESFYMIVSFLFALLILIGCLFLNRFYYHNNRVLLFLGAISYFFYLDHERICWALINRYGVNDLLIWVLFTIAISFVLKKVYSSLIKVLRLY